jgi:hypothetical protein
MAGTHIGAYHLIEIQRHLRVSEFLFQKQKCLSFFIPKGFAISEQF